MTTLTTAQRFMAVFAGLPRAYGIYVIGDEDAKPGKKRKGKADTLQHDVTEELWERHLRGEIQLGIVPIRDDATCVFGAIDIDVYPLDHAALLAKIRKLKLPLTMIRSKSGGAHLMVFLATPMPAVEVRERLSDWAAALGHADVEIFPKQNKLHSTEDTGNWINMPYCGGDKTDRYALIESGKLSIETFLAHAETTKTMPKALAPTEPDAPELLEEGPPCLIQLSSMGAPEGGRNIVMFNYAVYARKRWGDDWPDRLAELNARFINPPLDETEVMQIAKHVEKKDYSYTCKDKPLCNLCVKAVCMKRKYGIGPSDSQEYFGLALKNVIRLETDPAVYFADMNGARITFEAEDLNSQTLFREMMIRQVNQSFPIMAAPRWNQFVIRLCADAEVVQAPPETRRHAQWLAWLEDYCVDQIPAHDWPDVVDGQVFTFEGRMYFRPGRWIKAMNKEHRARLEIKPAYLALKTFGLEREDRVINGKKHTLWSVPKFERDERKKAGSGDL